MVSKMQKKAENKPKIKWEEFFSEIFLHILEKTFERKPEREKEFVRKKFLVLKILIKEGPLSLYDIRKKLKELGIELEHPYILRIIKSLKKEKLVKKIEERGPRKAKIHGVTLWGVITCLAQGMDTKEIYEAFAEYSLLLRTVLKLGMIEEEIDIDRFLHFKNIYDFSTRIRKKKKDYVPKWGLVTGREEIARELEDREFFFLMKEEKGIEYFSHVQREQLKMLDKEELHLLCGMIVILLEGILRKEEKMKKVIEHFGMNFNKAIAVARELMIESDKFLGELEKKSPLTPREREELTIQYYRQHKKFQKKIRDLCEAITIFDV